MDKEEINILVVDDDESIRMFLTTLLTDTGYSVTQCENGLKGLEELKKNNHYSVIITDLQMPIMSGPEFIKNVKEMQDITPTIIVITAYPSVESAVNVMKEGVYDYIAKPFNINELRLTVGRAVENYTLITQRQFYKELSFLDGLTNVYNRRYFDEIIEKELQRAKRYAKPFSLLLLDLDNFKNFNDEFGHIAGDKLLVEFSNILVTNLRKIDFVFRYGGEEFVVFLPETDIEKAKALVERVLEKIRETLSVTASIGITEFIPSRDAGKNAEDIVGMADKALYKAKDTGKDRYCIES